MRTTTNRSLFIPRGGTHLQAHKENIAPVQSPRVGGNTSANRSSVGPYGYPRVGGNTVAPDARKRHTGSSPRGRGTPNDHPQEICMSVHPRCGGGNTCIWKSHFRVPVTPQWAATPACTGRTAGHERFIPAWAGNTHQARFGARRATVHPRVGGEHNASNPHQRSIIGSSPRGRGTLQDRN